MVNSFSRYGAFMAFVAFILFFIPALAGAATGPPLVLDNGDFHGHYCLEGSECVEKAGFAIIHLNAQPPFEVGWPSTLVLIELGEQSVAKNDADGPFEVGWVTDMIDRRLDLRLKKPQYRVGGERSPPIMFGGKSRFARRGLSRHYPGGESNLTRVRRWAKRESAIS